MSKIPVAILGATGAVGQKFAMLLDNHPYFDVQELFASERSEGMDYGSIKWLQNREIPSALRNKKLKSLQSPVESPLCFSALDAAVAEQIEIELANAGHWVITNAKSHRMHPAVPLIVPEVNWTSWKLAMSHWKQGGIIANPNCCVIGLALTLFPLQQRFGLEKVKIVTLQAVSGAGYPGTPSLEIFDNIIPHIPEEVKKIEEELPKVFGSQVTISAQVNRVPVLDGHSFSLSVKLAQEVGDFREVEEAWREFVSALPWGDLPSAPQRLFYLEKNPFFPQPRLHRDREGGMAITIGPLERCGILDWKFNALTHNTVRGAAGGTILIGEALYREGVFFNGTIPHNSVVASNLMQATTVEIH